MQYHVDGELVPENEATVSVLDRGFMYGDAAFETLRVYGGAPFEWGAHRDRLAHTAETLGFADAVPDDLRERIDETLAANDLREAYCKVSVSRGVQPGKLTPDSEVDPTVVVVVKPLPRGGRDGERVWDGPAAVQTVRTRRVPDEAVPSGIKSHNYLNGILGRLELRKSAGEGDPADECLLRDIDGNLVEGATSNLFFVTENGLRTPSAELDLLPGVTRDIVIELARDEGFPVETGAYSLDALRNADEAFLTNSTWEIRPVETVDGIEVGAGPMTKLLQRLYDERVEERHY
ncbi:aminotransferase class IV [Haloarcula onubensis]|uniref:Aminotransferase class IV n=1 Tax=Haloarcula onubensis TaxID=2950539 RepID=A0ABU2FLS0_9EURY|nr:aminotransferase class IV [Halomicroarcula sp. S3CR25-11]MDS0281344.1 aminotransferase class IV [Halomicroarcula sp. S3CR25-11]